MATPIGNARDITLRALDLLTTADAIACEDTRITAKLLHIHGISPAGRLLAYHDHNAERVRPRLLDRVRRGEVVAVVSDAGTPALSDPGFRLVRACIEADLPLTTVPGPAAPVVALSLSGLPMHRALFAGFLPPRRAARRAVIAELANVPASLVFFESPRRLSAGLADLADILGPRQAAVARELTKLFEELRRAPLDALAAHYAEAGAPKGEVVVLVGPPEPEDSVVDLDQLLGDALSRLSLRDAVAEVVSGTGLPRRGVYLRALELSRAAP